VADFTITISNSLSVFGPAPSDKWGAFNWNEFLWGEGTIDLAVAVSKTLSNSLVLTDAFQKTPNRVIQNVLTVDADMGSERLSDAAGYDYVFLSNTTEAEDRATPSWASAAAGASTWTSATAGNTNWS